MKNKLLLITFLIACLYGNTQDKITVTGIDIHLQITGLSQGKGDTLWATISGGSSLGLKKGSKGTAVQVYKSKEHDYKVLTSAVVTDVSPSTATAFVLVKEGQKSTYLTTDDQVVFNSLELPFYGADDNSLLRMLAALNIRFVDQSKIPFYEQLTLLKKATTKTYDSLLRSMQTDIIETADYLKEEVKEKPKAWTDPFTSGKYKGVSMLSAMEKTSLTDVESFLHFVIEYPGKYLGHQWKINETYATWLINDMPMPTDKSYLAKSFLRLPQSAITVWAKENNFYYDSLKSYVTSTLDKYITDQKADSAEFLLAKATLIAETVKDASFLSTIYTNKGQLLQQKGISNQQAALSLYNKAVDLDSSNWLPYWNRGNLYADLDQLANAIKDMKKLTAMYPFYSNAWGNQGWWYLKQFKVKEAGAYCLKAYELDSSSAAWAINLAHYYLLSGQNEKARAAYAKTLKNLKSESEFINGSLMDFDFFAGHGILDEAFGKEKAWMLQQYNDTYKHYLRADSLFELAKTFQTKKEFNQAALLFLKSRDEEKAATTKRNLSIHNITTWIGYMYLQQKDYSRCEQFYTEALAMAKDSFPQQMANDLDLLSELHQKKGNKALADAFQSQAIGWRNKPSYETSNGDLHIVSIGIDQYPDVTYQAASADAEKVVSALINKGKRFSHVYSYTLTNKHAISDSVDRTMQRVIAKAKEDDTFVFYFTGKAVNTGTESYLVPFGIKDSDSALSRKAISAPLLRSWSNSINAKHQFFLLDAAANNFSSAFANQSTSYSKSISQKDLVMLCATFPRIEMPNEKTSIVASSLVNLFTDSTLTDEKTITGKKIESFFADELTRKNYFLSLESYTQGRDFVLAENNPVAKTRSSNTEVAVSNVRGAGVENVSQSGNYSVGKRYGLFIATDVYADPKWSRLNNPISDATELKSALAEEYGFEIELLANPTKQQIFNKIDEYSRKRFDKNDQLVILFAGHGYYDGRRNEGYLVPSDANYTDVEFDRYYYPMSSIMRDLRIIPAQHMMVLVDACHGGAICDNALMRGDGDDLYNNLSMDQLVRNHLEYPNRLILTSGRKDQRVPDGVKGKNSPFIAAILTALRSEEAQKKKMVSYYQLMKYISDVQKTQATSAIFSPNDNWNFMFFKKASPIADPTGVGGRKP